MSVTSSDREVGSPARVLPRGAGSIAFTEFWERFSFYGLSAILFYYLIFSVGQGGLELTPAIASSIVGAYGGLIYVSQILGAWAGDRIFPPQAVILGGGVVILAGHLVLALVPGLLGVGLGLGLLVLGTGALKTNITAVFGFILDEQGTASRDGSFVYYYTWIMAGLALGPLATGYMQSAFGFHWGFGLAAIGMAVSLVVYLFATRKLPDRARIVVNPLRPRDKRNAVVIAVAVVAVVAVAIALTWINLGNLAVLTSALAIVAAIWYFVALLSSRINTSSEKQQVRGYVPLFVAACLYYAIGFQLYTSVATLIATKVDLHLGSWEFPIAWITGVAGFAPLLIGPVLGAWWKRQGDRQATPPVKFATAFLIQFVTHGLLLTWALVSGSWVIPLLVMIIFMLVSFVAEMFLGPVGLSLATAIGPSKSRGQIVALNFLTLAIGAAIGGVLGTVYTLVDTSTYFAVIVAVAFVSAAGLLIFRGPITRLLRLPTAV